MLTTVLTFAKTNELKHSSKNEIFFTISFPNFEFTYKEIVHPHHLNATKLRNLYLLFDVYGR